MNAIDKNLSAVKLAVFDVDGVLTDAKLYFNDEGVEHKAFDARDGLGIKILMEYGVEVAIMTGRKSKSTKARLHDNLGIPHYFEGILDKLSVMQALVKKLDIDLANVVYVGDDLIDLGVMSAVGVAVAVQDAEQEVKDIAHIILARKGGQGAVRELCQKVLVAQGKWDDIITTFKQGKKYTN